MITGYTPNGGGTWKHILHGNKNGVLRRNLPIMVQALHFKDYSVTPDGLKNFWRKRGLREHYSTAGGLKSVPGDPYTIDYQGEIFFDSGGFVFMFGAPEGLEKFGLHGDKLQEELINLKLDLGATKLASLDYPIPPGLTRKEAKERLEKTKQNALHAARIMLERGHKGGLVLPVHGSTARQAGQFTKDLLEAFEERGLTEAISGLGLGSMVPLRRNHRTPEIVSYVEQVRANAGELPLHVFGVTGLLTPFLLNAGATSFDSSNYIQKARVLKFVDAGYHERQFRDFQGEYPCDCPVCKERNLIRDQAIMAADRKDPNVLPGEKSQVYAALALHNLQQDLGILELANQHHEAGTLTDYMQELSFKYPRMRQLLVGKMPKPATRRKAPTCDPDDYDVRHTYYKPKKNILLLLPCSSEKPYTSSRTYKQVWNTLLAELGADVEHLEVVFVSGLYGPVPLAHVSRTAVKRYDFLLTKEDTIAAARVNGRMSEFLQQHEFKYKVAYLAPTPYRQAIQGLGFTVLPESNSSRYSHSKAENLRALALHLKRLIRDIRTQEESYLFSNSSTNKLKLVPVPLPCPSTDIYATDD